uniref:Uncharacterized protein n=1 Tax=Corethron hystrix TaxID=216773 RepID=A0A7S1BAG9_9STRA|mmetsp:Transcript_19413/g.44223  ORF Transcript_19413/g.44223 Transcript_19413/m.44223 type:complete len:171 (+) Transcript_19413:15-527(+)
MDPTQPQSITLPPPPSKLISRVQSFLPLLGLANQKLLDAPSEQCSRIDHELKLLNDSDDDEGSEKASRSSEEKYDGNRQNIQFTVALGEFDDDALDLIDGKNGDGPENDGPIEYANSGLEKEKKTNTAYNAVSKLLKEGTDIISDFPYSPSIVRQNDRDCVMKRKIEEIN